MNIIETDCLGKRYGKSWALLDCTLAVPEGILAALVGPNGAGKSTLMNMAVGLTVPTDGTVTVLGDQHAGSPVALDDIAFMAQDAPVYKSLSVGDMLHLTKNLNRRFDQPFAKARLAELGIPLKKKTGKLSGGQQSQVALTLALARRPRLLILDEPLSALDPLARQDFLATVMTSMADEGVTLAVVAGAFGAVFTWMFQPFWYPEIMNVMTDTVFDTYWLVFGAFTLVAFMTGAFLGMLFRRVIPAMAATLGVYLLVRLVAWDVRKYYPVSVVTSNAKIFNAFQTPSTPGFPWILSTWFTGPGGKPVSQTVINQFAGDSHPYGSTSGEYNLPAGYTEWNRYIPFSHFWPMQFIEVGWLLILALAFGAAAVSLVRRRAA